MTAALRGCDVVVHLAARAHVLRETAQSPEDAFRRANLDAAVVVANAAKACQIDRLVLISSIGVNGDHTEGRAFKSSDVPAPHDLYAISKWDAERAIAQALADSQTSWTVLRPCLVYASDCPGNFERLLRMVQKMPLIPLGGLTRKRSLIHVDNLCEAIAVAALHANASQRTFVLSDGVDLSVAELVRLLSQGMGRSPRSVVNVPEALLRIMAGAVGRTGALDKLAQALEVDVSDFQTATGWCPPRSPYEALLLTAREFAVRA